MSQERDETNTGILNPADGMKVLRSGWINVDGVKMWAIITFKKNEHGSFIEIWTKAGGAKTVAPENKRGPSSPDLSGGIEINGKGFWFSGWKKDGQYGPFTSVSIRPKEGGGQSGGAGQEPSKPSAADYDDDIPF